MAGVPGRLCYRCMTLPRATGASYCNPCQHDLLAESHSRHPCVVATLEARDAPCADCKERFPPPVMDLDHVRGPKLFKLTSNVVRTKPLHLVLAEIAKCEVRCANCHRLRHYGADRASADQRDREAIARWHVEREARRARTHT